MRTLNKNKQKMWYANRGNLLIPIYETYVDDEGKEHQIETGEYERPYLMPVEFSGNIATSGGDAESVEYGLNLADYEAILVVDKDCLPITETSLIWLNTEPVINEDDDVDESSADYFVRKKAPSLNSDKFILKKVVKPDAEDY